MKFLIKVLLTCVKGVLLISRNYCYLSQNSQVQTHYVMGKIMRARRDSEEWMFSNPSKANK